LRYDRSAIQPSAHRVCGFYAVLFQRIRAPTGGMLSVNSVLGDATGAMDGDITELLKKSRNCDVQAGNALY
jgi:hypothetical protein